MIHKSSYVEVHNIIFKGGERTAKIPEETKKVPYEMFVNGVLLENAEIGQIVEVKTITGRIVKGTLKEVNPTFNLGFGEFVPHILKIKQILRDELYE